MLVGRRNRVHTEPEARLSMLRAQIAQGEYRVDPYLVADAILRRVFMGVDEARLAQKECSYPSSPPSASSKNTPLGPSTTPPIQVKPVLATAASASLRALGGMQAHSS